MLMVYHWKICKSICFIDDSAAESVNGNETAGHSSSASGGTHCRDLSETNSNGKTSLEPDEQPLNLSDSLFSAQLTSEYRLDDESSDGKNKYKNILVSDLKMEQEAKENGSKVRCFHVHKILQKCISLGKKHFLGKSSRASKLKN